MKIRSTFSYLDRTFLLNTKSLHSINDMCISLFRRMLFPSKEYESTAKQPLGVNILEATCYLVDLDRQRHVEFDSQLLRDTISMLHVFGIYARPLNQSSWTVDEFLASVCCRPTFCS